ncbi:hypothetical protein ACVWXQ_000160 [Bradyrhizobium sp. S3.14.4]
MAGLWEIEADLRGQDPETRVKARQEKSAAIVAALFDLWNKELPRLSGKFKLAEAICYATSRRTAPRALSKRRSSRDRLQHRRARNPVAKPSQEKMRSLRAAMAAAGPGRPSPRFCRPRR